MKSYLWELSGLLLPTVCAGCGAGRRLLCARCERSLLCGPVRRAWPRPALAGLPPVYAAAEYSGPLRSVLLAHKERGALPLAMPLGAVLARAVRAAARGLCLAPPWRLLLVPVPSGRQATARRGHDPLWRIATAAARRLRAGGLAAQVCPLLRHVRSVADQAGLDAAARHVNLAGALSAAAPRGGWRHVQVILLDDVMTTGASLAESARAVRVAAGAGPASATGRSVDIAAAVAAIPAGLAGSAGLAGALARGGSTAGGAIGAEEAAADSSQIPPPPAATRGRRW